MNPFRSQSLSRVAGALLVAVLLVQVAYFGIWQWTICRIEVPAGSSLLVRYKGPWPFGTRPQRPREHSCKPMPPAARSRSASSRPCPAADAISTHPLSM